MDSGVKDANSTTNCNGGSKPSYCVEESKEEADKAEEEDGDGESKSLLQSAKVANGGLAKKRRQKSSRRRVQWNDRNGDKLAEILEYQPSDSSDSEDEYEDSCICTIMKRSLAYITVASAIVTGPAPGTGPGSM